VLEAQGITSAEAALALLAAQGLAASRTREVAVQTLRRLAARGLGARTLGRQWGDVRGVRRHRPSVRARSSIGLGGPLFKIAQVHIATPSN
jgi:hypothetical protein